MRLLRVVLSGTCNGSPAGLKWRAVTATGRASVCAALLGLLLALGGCGSVPKPESNTLATNKLLPTRDVSLLYSSARWLKIEHRPYVGYVILRATVSPNGAVHVLGVEQSYPDHALDGPAIHFASRVVMDPPKTGRWTDPPGTLYTVFYRSAGGALTALSFGTMAANGLPIQNGGYWCSVDLATFYPDDWRSANGSVALGESLTPDHVGDGHSLLVSGPGVALWGTMK